MTRYIALFVPALLLSACSVKLVYNNLDYLIPEYVEDMVTLDDVLEQKLDHRTERLLSWHRGTQLQRYADWLRAVQQDVGPGLTEAQLDKRLLQAERFWLDLADRLNHEMAHLLPLLDAAQLRELFHSIEDKNREFREEYIAISEEERREQNFERLADNYEEWFGDLTRAQEKLIEQAAAQLLFTAELRLQRRYQWQTGIMEILASEDTRARKEQRLREFFAAFIDVQGTAMQQRSDANRHLIIRLSVRLAQDMTREQKEHFDSRTGDLIRVLEELARGE